MQDDSEPPLVSAGPSIYGPQDVVAVNLPDVNFSNLVSNVLLFGIIWLLLICNSLA